MQLSSSEPCVVILTEKEVEVSVNNHATFTLPKNYLAAFACNNNVIELSTLNHVLITHINRNIINDYLLFLNKNLTCVKPWSRLATPVIACHSRTPEVFRLAANQSKQQPSKPCEAELTRALLFTVLSNFLEQSRFIALLMYILRSSVARRFFLHQNAINFALPEGAKKTHSAQCKNERKECLLMLLLSRITFVERRQADPIFESYITM